MNSYQWETKARIAKYESRKMFLHEVAAGAAFLGAIAVWGLIWALLAV